MSQARRVVNLTDVPLRDAGNGKSFQARVGRIAPMLGLAGLGCALTVVPPGKPSQTIGTWWVVAVNPTANIITLVNPNSGPVRTFDVTTQAGREQLPRVKPGDSLTAINSQVLVLSITPKA